MNLFTKPEPIIPERLRGLKFDDRAIQRALIYTPDIIDQVVTTIEKGLEETGFGLYITPRNIELKLYMSYYVQSYGILAIYDNKAVYIPLPSGFIIETGAVWSYLVFQICVLADVDLEDKMNEVCKRLNNRFKNTYFTYTHMTPYAPWISSIKPHEDDRPGYYEENIIPLLNRYTEIYPDAIERCKKEGRYDENYLQPFGDLSIPEETAEHIYSEIVKCEEYFTSKEDCEAAKNCLRKLREICRDSSRKVRVVER